MATHVAAHVAAATSSPPMHCPAMDDERSLQPKPERKETMEAFMILTLEIKQ